MQVNYKISGAGIVNGRLGDLFPGLMGGIIVRENANHIDFIQISKLCAIRANKPAAENQMQQLFFIGHSFIQALPPAPHVM